MGYISKLEHLIKLNVSKKNQKNLTDHVVDIDLLNSTNSKDFKYLTT